MPIIAQDPDQRPASDAQLEFMRILLNDQGYDTKIKMLSFINGRIDRKIAHLDELTMSEARFLLDELVESRGYDTPNEDGYF